MNVLLPSSLDSAALARRLGELVGQERHIQVEFLLHLDEFDRRRAYLEVGFGSLWDYCLRALHLREGAAGRRIGAMRVLRRFPRLEAALRDGRLCLSTVSLLGQVLTHENLEELVERAAYRTKAAVEHLVVSIKPRPAPLEGVRRLPAPASPPGAPGVQANLADAAPAVPDRSSALGLTASLPAAPSPGPGAGSREPAERPRATSPEVRPVAEDRWSVRVTLDAEAKAELDELTSILSHKIPSGDLGAVVREAIRCALEKHGKRKRADRKGESRIGASAPALYPRGTGRATERAFEPDSTGGSAPSADGRQSPDAAPAAPSRYVPASVRREVWMRDGGRCTFEGPDGSPCGSQWQLELDHVTPAALGGTSTADDLRLRCRAHNLLEAERVFGREHMDRFRRAGLPTAGDGSSPGRAAGRSRVETASQP